MEDLVLEERGYSQATGIYYPKWEDSPPLPPHHHPLSLPAFLLPQHSHHHLKPAFVDAKSRRAVSYADAGAAVSSLARLLRLRHGLRKGDVVLLVAPNSVDFPVLALAIMASGAVFSTANPMNTRAELHMQVDDSRPVLIVTTAELRHKLDGLVSSTSSPPLLVDDLLQSATSSNNDEQWTDHHDDNNNNNNNNSMVIEQGDTAALMYSSGTTGKSKAVVCTHRNLITMGCLLRHVWGRAASEEVYLCVVPLFHMFGLSVFVCGAVAAGATVVVLANGRYSMEEAMAAVEEHGVSRLLAVPPMVVEMVRRGGVGKGYDLSSLKEVICSGAPLARDFMERFPLCYPHVTLSQVSGGHEV